MDVRLGNIVAQPLSDGKGHSWGGGITVSQERQLAQLSRLDPAKLESVCQDIQRFPTFAGRLIGQALADVWKSGFPADLCQRLEAAIQDLNTGRKILSPRGRLMLFQNGRYRLILERTKDNRLRLFCSGPGIPKSMYVGQWGRDWDRLSSAYAGQWKLIDGLEGKLGVFARDYQKGHQ